MMSKSWCLSCNSLEDVIDKRVHDAHCSTGNTNIWMNLLQNSIDETSITLLSCSLSLDNFCPSLALATFLGAFLCRALLRALHRRGLSTGTHLKRLLTTIVRCLLRLLATETDASKDCTPIYVLGLDRNGKSKRGSKLPKHSILWIPLSSQSIRFQTIISIRIWIRKHSSGALFSRPMKTLELRVRFDPVLTSTEICKQLKFL